MERQYAGLMGLAVVTGLLGATGNVVFRAAISTAAWCFEGLSAPFGRPGIPLALVAGGLVLLVLDRAFPGEVVGYGFPRFLEMLPPGGTGEAAVDGWVGRSLRELDCRARYGVTVLAVQPRGREAGAGSELPDPDRPLAAGDMLVPAGTADGLRLAQVA